MNGIKAIGVGLAVVLILWLVFEVNFYIYEKLEQAHTHEHDSNNDVKD